MLGIKFFPIAIEYFYEKSDIVKRFFWIFLNNFDSVGPISWVQVNFKQENNSEHLKFNNNAFLIGVWIAITLDN